MTRLMSKDRPRPIPQQCLTNTRTVKNITVNTGTLVTRFYAGSQCGNSTAAYHYINIPMMSNSRIFGTWPSFGILWSFIFIIGQRT